MTSKGRKTNRARNLRLKVAILESGWSQREVALKTRIGEVRLSQIVNRLRAANPDEQERLAKVLERPIVELFPFGTNTDRVSA